MTTITARLPAGRGALAAEWIKLRSVRSTYLTLLFAAVAAVVIGYLVTRGHATCSPPNGSSSAPSAPPT